jgi:hypothetical protein
MIDPGIGMMGFRIAIFIVLMAVVCLFIVEPGSAAFYVDVIALVIALVFAGVLIVLIRRKQ